jgi:hypothetical protein
MTKKQIGVGILFGIVILIGLWWALPSFLQARADATVREMCAKDGQVKVYETVRLPKTRFVGNSVVFNGTGPIPPREERKKTTDEYVFKSNKTWIIDQRSFGPAAWRLHDSLIRTADGKVLGESVVYARIGGDPIGPWQQSSFLCPPGADIAAVVRQVFISE